MADIDKSKVAQVQTGTFANKWYNHTSFVPTAATTIGDKVLLAVLPAGTKLLDAVAFVEDALTDMDLGLGFRYKNGEAGSDEEYFLAATTDTAAGGKFRATANKPPIVLQYDAYLVATLGGAAFPTTNKLDVVVDYDYIGPVTDPA